MTSHQIPFYLNVDKNIDPDLLNELIQSTQQDYPEASIKVVYKEPLDKKSNLSPSMEKSSYWLAARRKKGDYPKDTTRSGKWLLFVDKTEIDQMWEKVKFATEEGRLGASSKVSTAKENPHAATSKTGVICVYTYDSEDREDVFKVRAELKQIGVNHKIPYKTDSDTRTGKYQVSGHKQISKYFD